MDKVVTIIEKDGQVLVGKVLVEKIADFGGIDYVFPGGGIEENESSEAAAVRETKEETNLEVGLVKQIGSRVHPKTGKTIYYFHAQYISGTPEINKELNDDLESLIWISKDELIKYMPTLNPDIKAYLNIQ